MKFKLIAALSVAAFLGTNAYAASGHSTAYDELAWGYQQKQKQNGQNGGGSSSSSSSVAWGYQQKQKQNGQNGGGSSSSA